MFGGRHEGQVAAGRPPQGAILGCKQVHSCMQTGAVPGRNGFISTLNPTNHHPSSAIGPVKLWKRGGSDALGSSRRLTQGAGNHFGPLVETIQPFAIGDLNAARMQNRAS